MDATETQAVAAVGHALHSVRVRSCACIHAQSDFLCSSFCILDKMVADLLSQFTNTIILSILQAWDWPASDWKKFEVTLKP